jgi:hypothetical protein
MCDLDVSRVIPFLRSRVAPADNATTQFAADGADDTGGFEPEHRRLLGRQQFLEIAAARS